MSYVIELEINDKKADAVFNRLDATLARLDASLKALQATLTASANNANKVAKGYSNIATQANKAAGSVARVNRASRVRVPPAFAAQSIADPTKVIAQYGAAALQGNPVAMRWVNAAMRQQNLRKRIYNKLSPPVNAPDPGRLVQGMGMAVSGGAMALRGMQMGAGGIGMVAHGAGLAMGGVGKMVSAGLASMLALINPVTVALGGLLVAITALTIAIMMGIKAIKGTMESVLKIGGSPGTAEAARRLERFTGASASGVAAQIRGGGIAAGIGAGFGINPVAEIFGGDSDAQMMIKIMKGLAGMDYQQARRTATGLGAPELAKIALLDEGTQKRLLEIHERRNSPEGIKAQAEFDANMVIVQDHMNRILKAFATPALGMMADVLEGIAKGVGAFGNAIFIVNELLRKFIDWIKSIFGMGGKNGRSEVEKNTEAVKENTQVMRDGLYGGRERAGGADVGSRLSPTERRRAQMRMEYGLL